MTVILGGFDAVLAVGVSALLRLDRRLRLLGCEFEDAAVEAALMRWAPRVAVLGEAADPVLVERLRSVCPETQILVLAYDPTPEYGMRMLAAGTNCVARKAPEIDLVDVILRTAQGERFCAAGDGMWIERRYPSGAEPLTKRERQVLMLLARDTSYAAIASALGIGYRTVQTHVQRTIEKLGVQDRRELVGMPVPGECATD